MTYLNAVDLYASVEALSFGVMSGHIVATRLLRCLPLLCAPALKEL